MRHLLLWLTAAAVLATPAVAPAQSLAELAAKEREKRKGQKAPKVIGDDELKRAGGGYVPAGVEGAAPTASPSPGAAPAAGGAERKEKTPEEARAEQEKAWRERLQKAQERARQLSQAAESLQKELNDLSGNIYGSHRTNMLAQLDKTKADLQQAQQDVANLEDEGRRNRYR